MSLRFVGVGWVDKEIIKRHNVTIANALGCNKEAVSEWIIAMMLNLVRQLPGSINTHRPNPAITPGLAMMKACVLGPGNIGRRVGKICEALDMQVNYFKRGYDLLESVRGADVIINTLSHNPETDGLLDGAFFQSLKKGSYFISVTSSKVFSETAMFTALDDGILAGAAIDCGDVQVGNSDSPDYIRMRDHPKVLATPHIAYNTTRTARVANDIMIDNIEAWIKGKPQNVV